MDDDVTTWGSQDLIRWLQAGYASTSKEYAALDELSTRMYTLATKIVQYENDPVLDLELVNPSDQDT